MAFLPARAEGRQTLVLGRLAILTCLFYWILCIALIAVYEYEFVYAHTRFVIFGSPHPLLGSILSFSVLFGGMWVMSYFAAWCIAYPRFRRNQP